MKGWDILPQRPQPKWEGSLQSCKVKRTLDERTFYSKKLSHAAAAYVNAALECHAFCILHHCTHESISQGNENHEAIENTIFRLGAMLIFFDDGYREAHR